jgi:Uncharacterized protein conserved in bacteria (DUF2130)
MSPWKPFTGFDPVHDAGALGNRLPDLTPPTGPRFRHRIEAIVENSTEMQEDLDKERKTMTRLWAKREGQIRIVIESTAGMYGDLQGIFGKTLLQEIEGLDSPAIEVSLDSPAGAVPPADEESVP